MNTNSLSSILVSNIQTEQEKHWKVGKLREKVAGGGEALVGGGGVAWVATPPPPPHLLGFLEFSPRQ